MNTYIKFCDEDECMRSPIIISVIGGHSISQITDTTAADLETEHALNSSILEILNTFHGYNYIKVVNDTSEFHYTRATTNAAIILINALVPVQFRSTDIIIRLVLSNTQPEQTLSPQLKYLLQNEFVTVYNIVCNDINDVKNKLQETLQTTIVNIMENHDEWIPDVLL